MTTIVLTPTDGQMCVHRADQILKTTPVEDGLDNTFRNLKQKVISEISAEMDAAYSKFMKHELFKID